ncbi:MAG: hypothetical protein HOE90_24035 [Bacteriovoracaceae bacterium]|jgi:hypothetical protein|nr:hypothetical protein [Bacteriovoracaceae bacterium]
MSIFLKLKTLILAALFFTISQSSLYGFELAVIQSVSVNGESFVTRNGKQFGIIPGQEMTFLTDEFSVVAKADKVTRHFTLWKPVDSKLNVPFHREQIVTMQKSSERNWSMFNPEQIANGGIRYPYALIGRWYYGKGLSQTVSGVDNISTDRTSYQIEALWQKKVFGHFAFGFGGRIERELSEIQVANIVSTRWFLIGEASYYFGKTELITDLNPYFALTIGVGRSSSTVANSNQSGMAYVLPCARFGAEIPMGDEFALQLEGALESLNANETFDNNHPTSMNQISYKLGISLMSLYR